MFSLFSVFTEPFYAMLFEFSSALDRGSRQENNDDDWCQTRIMQINLNGTWEQNENPNSIQVWSQDTQIQKNVLEIHTPTKWRKFISTHFLVWMYFLKRACILFTLILSYKLYIINLSENALKVRCKVVRKLQARF